MENNRGQINMLGIMYFGMGLLLLIAFIPMLNSLINISMQSDYLNCQGYYYNGNVNNPLSYNNSLASNTLACIGIRLYLPYIIVALLIAGVSGVLQSRASSPVQGF